MANIRKAIKHLIHPHIDIIYNQEGERGPYYYFSWDMQALPKVDDVPPQLMGAYQDGVYHVKREEYSLKRWVALAAAWHRDCYENNYLYAMEQICGEEIKVGIVDQE